MANEDPLERIEREERERKEKKGPRTVMTILACVAAALALVLGYLLYQRNTLVSALENEKTELAQQMKDLQTDFSQLSSDYDTINSQKMRGVAVIYVGEDLDVLLELSDRILVLCGGRVSGIVPGRGAKKREVGMMMTKLQGGEDHAE